MENNNVIDLTQEVKEPQQEPQQQDNLNNVKNNNMLCDIILKVSRITSLSYEVLDFNNALNYNDAMILTKSEYENIDQAITTIAELLRKKHISLIQNYQSKKGVK